MWRHFLFVLSTFPWLILPVSSRFIYPRKLYTFSDCDVDQNNLDGYESFPKARESAIARTAMTSNSLEGYMDVELSESLEHITSDVRLFEPLPAPEHYTLAPPRNDSKLFAGEYRELHDGRWVDVASPVVPDTEQLLWVPNQGIFASRHLDRREVLESAMAAYVLKEPPYAEPLKPGEYKERSQGRFVQVGAEPGEVGPRILWVPHHRKNMYVKIGFDEIANANTNMQFSSVTPTISPPDPYLFKRSLKDHDFIPSRWPNQLNRMMGAPCQEGVAGCVGEGRKPLEKIPVIEWAKPGALALYLFQNQEQISKQQQVANSIRIAMHEKHASEKFEPCFEIPDARGNKYSEVINPAAGGNFHYNPGNRKAVEESRSDFNHLAHLWPMLS